MKSYLIIILIGLVSGFLGILPLLRAKADKYALFAFFVFYCLMPYVITHVSVSGLRWWMKGASVTLVLILPLLIMASKNNKKCILQMLGMSVAVGAFISFLEHYLL